jgi:phosphoglucosamine mutase
MKLVLDCANGAASLLGPALFRSLGAEVIAIHNQPNGRNINDGCGSLHPEKLREKVLETRRHSVWRLTAMPTAPCS